MLLRSRQIPLIITLASLGTETLTTYGLMGCHRLNSTLISEFSWHSSFYEGTANEVSLPCFKKVSRSLYSLRSLRLEMFSFVEVCSSRP